MKKQIRVASRFIRKSFIMSGLAVCVWLVIGLSRFMSAPVLPSDDIPMRLYANQVRDDIGMTFAAAIERAQKSVFISMYSLTDRGLMSQLRTCAEGGLDVAVVCDPGASNQAPKRLGPKVHTTFREPLGLMHQKIIIIDGEEVWIGSANLTSASLRQHGNLIMGLKSRELADSIMHHLSLSHETTDEDTPHSFRVGQQDIELWILPMDVGALDRLVGLIESARTTLRVAMFTFTHPRLTDALIEARKRGVDVEVIVDYQSGSGTSGKAVRRLQRHGVPVALSDGMGLLHHKFAWIDDRTLVHGSANWTRSAFGRNDEVMTVVSDLGEDQQRLMRRLWRVLHLDSKEL